MKGSVIKAALPERDVKDLEDLSKFKDRPAFDAAILEMADYFTATRFLGRAKYDIRRAKTRRGARQIARRMAREANRTVMIYAVKGSRSAHVENVEPDGKIV